MQGYVIFITCFHVPKHKKSEISWSSKHGVCYVYYCKDTSHFLMFWIKETCMKYHISFCMEIPLEWSCIISMKCHGKPEDVFPVMFSGQKRQGNINFFAVHVMLFLILLLTHHPLQPPRNALLRNLLCLEAYLHVNLGLLPGTKSTTPQLHR